MKKTFLLSLLSLLTFGVLTACKDDDTDDSDRGIQIDAVSLHQEFGQEAETRFVPVTHSKIFDLKSSDDSWCHVKRTGNGLQITGINITVDENLQAQSREADITIWARDADPVVIEVIQRAAPAELSVKEKSILIRNQLIFNLTVMANFEVDFELPAWIQRTSEDVTQGIYTFMAEALEQDGEPRESEIVVKAKQIENVEPVVVPVRQEQGSETQLPEAPTIPEPEYKAYWTDLYFVKDGYCNVPTNPNVEGEDRVEIRAGAKTPASVWSDAVKCYVASYSEATSDTFYAAVFDDRMTSNVYSEPTAIQHGFTMETYLKVSDVSQEYIRPFANFDARGNGQLGLGLQIINGDAKFSCANMSSQYQHIEVGPWNTEKYYHIVAVYQGSKRPGGNTMVLYVDGVQVGESAALGEWTTVVWDKIRGIGIGGNFAQPSDDDPAVLIKDGMVGEIAFFRWYSDELTVADVTARYNMIAARAACPKFADLRTMVETTLPVKADSGVSGELRTAIQEAISLGESLMGNFETTEPTVDAYLSYAHKLLEFE